MRKLLEAESREEGGSRCTERCNEGPGWELSTQEPTFLPSRLAWSVTHGMERKVTGWKLDTGLKRARKKQLYLSGDQHMLR